MSRSSGFFLAAAKCYETINGVVPGRASAAHALLKTSAISLLRTLTSLIIVT